MNSAPATTELCPGCLADKGLVNVCPHCGYDESLKRGPLVLPHRTLLNNGQYLIGKVLGKPGGFGITYLALDTKLETRVAIKEYLPRDLAGRDGDHATVSAHSAEDGEFFRYGLTQFLQEARTLARFDHANIVRVRNFFEENGTGYLVMDYYDGITLADYLSQQPQGKLPEKTAVDILMPILDGLREVHGKNFLHRDIKPQNIYLTTGNRAILLDFGAARQAMGERSRSISVVLSEGYAPYEQYHRRGEQGPWTDIYACAAVLYHAVAGQAPPPATERVSKDELDIGALGVSASLTNALRLGLAVDHHNRPQTMTEFQALLMADTKLVKMDDEELGLNKIDLYASPEKGSNIQLNAHGEIVAVIPVEPAPSHITTGQKLFRALLWVIEKSFKTILWVSLGLIAVVMVVMAIRDGKQIVPTAEVPVPIATEIKSESDKVPTVHASPPVVSATEMKPSKEVLVEGSHSKCKVNDKDIADSYSGGCQNGLAHGEGLAKGRDEYLGTFSKGNANGQGIYIWGASSDWAGERYEGGYSGGSKHGFGVSSIEKNAKNADVVRAYKLDGKLEGSRYVRRGYFEYDGFVIACETNAACLDKLAEADQNFEQGNQFISRKEYSPAYIWIKKAAEQGSARAQTVLGVMYLSGELGVDKNIDEGLRWTHKAANRSRASAQSVLGKIYSSSDPTESAKWNRKAADQGFDVAQYDLGFMYENGQGVARDDVEAVRWYRKAADQGNSDAKAQLRKRGIQ